MDTVFVVITDTIKTTTIGMWFSDPTYWAAAAAIVSAVAALVIFLYSRYYDRRSAKRDMNVEWGKLSKSRAIFWEMLKNGYERWLDEIHRKEKPENQRPVDNLKELISRARVPSKIHKIKSIRQYMQNLRSECKGWQKWVLDFSSRVYPPSEHQKSIVVKGSFEGKAQYDRFNSARRDHSDFFDTWAEFGFQKYLRKRFGETHYHQFVLLCWLELCLCERVDTLYGRGGNRHLFKLAYKVDREYGQRN